MAFFSVIALLACVLILWPHINSIRGAVFISPRSYRITVGKITESCSTYIGGKSRLYAFHIVYFYSLGSGNYSSDQVSFGQQASTERAFADAYARKYPVGLNVLVHYKADEPAFAVLEPINVGETRRTFWGTLAVSFVCVGVLVASVWGQIRAR